MNLTLTLPQATDLSVVTNPHCDAQCRAKKQAACARHFAPPHGMVADPLPFCDAWEAAHTPQPPGDPHPNRIPDASPTPDQRPLSAPTGYTFPTFGTQDPCRPDRVLFRGAATHGHCAAGAGPRGCQNALRLRSVRLLAPLPNVTFPLSDHRAVWASFWLLAPS